MIFGAVARSSRMRPALRSFPGSAPKCFLYSAPPTSFWMASQLETKLFSQLAAMQGTLAAVLKNTERGDGEQPAAAPAPAAGGVVASNSD